jgi:hypothetical protein
LKLGAIPEDGDMPMLGIGIIGGADWGPWGEGRRASKEVESSIYVLARAFATSILHAVSPTFAVRLEYLVGSILQGHSKRANARIIAVEEQDRYTQPDDKGKEGTCPFNGSQQVYHCY